MSKYLAVIDVQNDFIDGSLGTEQARAVLPGIIEKVKNFNGPVMFTRDTREEDYLETQEGRLLPVEHCIVDTYGWQLQKDLMEYAIEKHSLIFDKEGFGSAHLAGCLTGINKMIEIDETEIIGLRTDVSVISNAMMLKSALPNMKITVDASCCAGTTQEKHRTALEAMKACQIFIAGEEENA